MKNRFIRTKFALGDGNHLMNLLEKFQTVQLLLIVGRLQKSYVITCLSISKRAMSIWHA